MPSHHPPRKAYHTKHLPQPLITNPSNLNKLIPYPSPGGGSHANTHVSNFYFEKRNGHSEEEPSLATPRSVNWNSGNQDKRPVRLNGSFEGSASNNSHNENVPPNMAQLILLCLDYMRNIRRSRSNEELSSDGLDAHHLSVAIYALSRSFLPANIPEFYEGNDPWIQEYVYEDGQYAYYPPINITPNEGDVVLPDIKTIEDEILIDHSSNEAGGVPEEYEYEDSHVSNTHRFYNLDGLASGGGEGGPITLPELVCTGMTHMGAKSRCEAEKEMIKSPLFHQFVSAVREKGFFQDAEEHENPEGYKDRYRKVVAKFRTKLATKAEAAMKSLKQKIASQHLEEFSNIDERNVRSPSSASSKKVHRSDGPSQYENADNRDHTVDLAEAERLKSYGNIYMEKKDYVKAVEVYTMALKLCPLGRTSHVYFSNRAAALLSMEKYHDAILDSERSLALKPDYGKAHARLGLAHYLLGDYELAINAYNLALRYEPNNPGSKNYLEKAKKKFKMSQSQLKKTDDENDMIPRSKKKMSRSISVEKEIGEERQNIIDQREADKLKSDGNTHMSRKEYQAAVDCYSQALDLCPNGNSSHVYYSNRAAALCYLERYAEAELDSEKSLALKPDYGKAHARLGLSRFFLGDYQGAVHAYTHALKYDPNNAASKSYLTKAKARLEDLLKEPMEMEF